jgi:hypothetical protein
VAIGWLAAGQVDQPSLGGTSDLPLVGAVRGFAIDGVVSLLHVAFSRLELGGLLTAQRTVVFPINHTIVGQ